MGMRHMSVLKGADLPLVAISDINREICDKVGQEYGVKEKHRYLSAIDMLEQTRPELVVIATTAPSHHDLVVNAVAAGARKILCEKPMATSLAECENMISVCEAAGVDLAINHQMRFMEQYTIPMQMTDSPELGGLGSVIVSAGNFGVAMNGVHYFEMFRLMTDENPISVNAWFDDIDLPNPRGEQFKDASGSVRLQTPSGKRFFMDCSGDQGFGMHVTYNCRYGRITVDELDGSLEYVAREAEYRDLPTTRYGMPSTKVAQSIAPADAVAPTLAVVKSLLAGLNYPTGENGLQTMRALIAAHLSNNCDGATINLEKDTLPRDLILPLA
jgi:predicted dehydrogenase